MSRGQSDLQSDALPLSYAPCYVTPLRYKVENDVQNKFKTNMLTLITHLNVSMTRSLTELSKRKGMDNATGPLHRWASNSLKIDERRRKRKSNS